MKRHVRYPVAFDAEVPRHREIKTVLAFVEGEVEIPEVHVADAPVCISVSDVDNLVDVREGDEFRLHEGRLLVDTGIPAEEFGRDEADDVEARGSIVLPLLESLRFKYGFGDGFHLYPQKAPQVLAGLIWSGGVRDVDRPIWSLMVEAGKLAPIDEAELQIWRDFARDRAATFAVIDGSVWKESAEPCYTVDELRPPGLTTRKADFYEKLRRGQMDSSSWSKLRDEGRNFSCLDRERAYAHARRAAAEGGFDHDDLPRIDVGTPDIPLLDFEAHEFERVSRLLVYDVADAFRKIAHGKGVDFFYSVPTDMMNAFTAARDCLVGMDARNGITIEQEDAMSALVSGLNLTVPRGNAYLARMSLDKINEVYDDWMSREIVSERIVQTPLPGGPR